MSTSTTSRPLRVFVVENHADTLNYYKMYLELEGHTVRQARTFSEALEQIPQADCDVLISDVGLPDGTGWELLQRLREEHRAHPSFSIAVSGFGSLEDRQRSKAAGFRQHLLKPFAPEKLDELLEEAAQERAVHAEP